MHAAVIHGYGGPEVLKYEEIPDLSVGVGEVVVQVAAVSINPVDLIDRSGGNASWNPLVFPAVIGWDVAGTIIEVGPNVSDFAIGDRVCAWATRTYAQRCAVKAELLATVPDGMPLEDAAAIPLVSLTGGQLISVASGVKPGQRVLVAGAAGSVGRSAVFMAKQIGATVIAGVQKKQLGGSPIVGADELLALDDDDALAKFAAVDIVANTVSGKTGEMLIGKVKPGGVFASATGAPDNAKDYPTVRVVAFVSKQDAAMLTRMIQAAAAGGLVIPIDRRIPLRDAAAGHAAVAKGGIGKVLLLP